MELDRTPHDTGEDYPPPPPPKLYLDTPMSSPPPSEDYFDLPSPSQPESLSQHVDETGSLPPPINGTSEVLLTPPIRDHADDSLAPSSPSSSSFRNKRSNPLTDLVESEREYIDILAGIIRKVAGAWSRTNFPPKRLDSMFRGIESVYKANRGLLTKLKDIGPTPTSPKELGDLLMRWIDDLDAPYTKYCTNFATGFDKWQPVASNTRLQPILLTLSAAYPPPLALLPLKQADSESSDSPVWTLDALFALPRARLKYYKKLYTRLLKSTQAGRNDHKLLTGAVKKLDNLLGMLVERDSIIIGLEDSDKQFDMSRPADPGVHLTPEDGAQNQAEKVVSNTSSSETTQERGRRSVGRSTLHSSLSPEARDSRKTSSSVADGRTTSSTTMSMPISDLERRLSTEMTLDLFTLTPRAIRLQMNPPLLTFTRALRFSCDVEIHFTPRSAPELPRVHTRGHIFLLTDLFLVCERMTPDERQRANSDGQDYDMFLLYPPLAGRHLRVSESSENDNILHVQILKKETLVLHADSKATRDHVTKEFKECIEEASLLTPQASHPPPPVPPLQQMAHSSSDPGLQHKHSQTNLSSRASSSVSPVTVSSLNASLRSSDQGKHEGDVPSSTQAKAWQPSTGPVANGIQNHPGMNVSLTDIHGGRMAFSSSQPQMQSLGPPPPHHFQQNPNTTSIPYIPPPRGTSHAHLHVAGQIDPPGRPATAPGEMRVGGPPFPPNYPEQYPARIQASGSIYPPLPRPHPNGKGAAFASSRPPSELDANAFLRKSPSARSLSSQYSNSSPLPAPGQPPLHIQPPPGFLARDSSINFSSVPHVHQPHPRVPFPPSATFNQRGSSYAATSSWGPPIREPTSPNSPLDEETFPRGPVISTITAQFKCKVFLKQHHGQWKSLGAARLKLYLQHPTNVKQLVAETDSKDKTILISTIVLTDGVERVGKTGVAIEVSDKGARTGIVYMIQLRNEASASGLFDSLLAGSDRAAGRTGKG